MVRDIRFALRRLAATPLFTTFANLSLAVGVAITTAVYSVVDAVFLRGLGIHEPDRVAVIVTPDSGRLLTGTVSEPDFRDVQTAQTSFSHVAASATFVRRLALPSVTEMVIGESVSGSYFATLGVSASLGRTIQPSDDAGGGRVVMLSETLWRRRFASDPRMVGATVAISGEPFEIIGVAPASFSGPRGWLMGTQFWIPLGTESRLKESPRTAVTAAPRATSRDDRRLTVFGRLATDVTIAAASAEMQSIAARLDGFFPPRFGGKGVGATDRPWRAKTIAAISDDEDSAVRRFGMTLVALVGLVLVVACTNLGNLVLARGSTRLRELAVRSALGASRWQLVREQCVESVMLAAGGAFASYVMFELLRVVMDTEFSVAMPFGGRTTLAFHPALNVPALTIAVSSLLIALVVFGLEPAIQLTRTLDVRGALAGGSAAGPERGRRQRLLLRWQVAIAAGFFVIATMFVKYSIAEARHDSGIDLDRIGVAVLNFDTPEWNEPRARRTFDRVLDELRRDPSVEAASLSSGLPFGVPSTLRLFISPLEQTSAARMAPQVVTTIAATPSMFRTLGVEILRGRGFDDRDGPAAPRVVVLSEFTARRMFGTADVVGREMAVGQTRSTTATIVGVAADTDVGRIFAEPRPLAYVPMTQHYQPLITVVARASGSVTTAVGAMRDAIRRADPDVAVDTIGTGRSVLAGLFQVLRGLGMTAIGLGATTLLLAMAGLYGIQSHVIANRTREIGVRMSLGATAGQIKRMVLVDGYRPVLDGLIFGLSIGLVGRAIARAYLELDVAIVDPWMLVVTPIPLICAAFFACYLPARRAAAVDPNTALRRE
ncbi:MAG TPA: ABC transporter permease [Vicinamibacterales bacterium]|nr:ABC transporter permease [Vicinamibacterales bacterium]